MQVTNSNYALFARNCSEEIPIYIIYCLFLPDACATQEVYMADHGLAPSVNIEDTKTCFETLNDILKCVIHLEQEHKSYLRVVEKEAVLGSQ